MEWNVGTLSFNNIPGIFWLMYDGDTHSSKKQWRSRGKHDPGSGPYENRIVIGGSEYALSGDRRYVKRLHQWGFPEHDWQSIQLLYWDGVTALSIWVSPPDPSDWQHPERQQWYVNWSYTRIKTRSIFKGDAGWWLTYDVSRNSTPYLAAAAYSDFGNSKRSAMGFAEKLCNDPFLGGRYPEMPYGGNYWVLEVKDLKWIATDPRMSENLDELALSLEVGGTDLHYQAGLANAYIDACDKLPHTTQLNNVQNIIQILSSLKDILLKHSLRRGLNELGSLSDAWLGWRYSYNTTKSDLEEASELVDRLVDLAGKSSTIRSNGVAYSGDWTFRCSIKVHSDELSSLQSTAEKWGMSLSAYNLWDLVPYSFILDWFVHVGDLLERWESQKYAYSVRPTECWTSIRTEGINAYGDYEIYYHRMEGIPSINLADVEWTSHSPSAVTVVKRATDVVCLLT